MLFVILVKRYMYITYKYTNTGVVLKRFLLIEMYNQIKPGDYCSREQEIDNF